MKRRPTEEEKVRGVSDDILRDLDAEANEDDMKQKDVEQRLLKISMESMSTRVMMLQDRLDAQEGQNKEGILTTLSDLFDRQISAVLAASGCQDPDEDASHEYALGLGFTAVAGNSSANINVQPQVRFRPERMVIPDSIADAFLITDIKVGKNSQLVSTGAVPAAAFTNRSGPSHLKMDVAEISMFVTVSVTNISDQAKNFQGVIFGPGMEAGRLGGPPRRFRRFPGY